MHATHTHTRPRRPRAVRAARMIERRPRTANTAPAVIAEPVIPIIRFDDEPLFIGSHLSAQMIQREWRWW
jgi:hypothetical protein